MVKSKKFPQTSVAAHLPRGMRIEKAMGTEECSLEGPSGLEGLLRVSPWPWGRDHSPSVIRFESVAACSVFKDMGIDKSPPLYSSLSVIEFSPFPTPSRAYALQFEAEQGIFSPCPSI